MRELAQLDHLWMIGLHTINHWEIVRVEHADLGAERLQ
ncbi:hypothetical protein PAMC26510_37500 [Caballeronia sordidicola]|uniref:Uncharacterized protein n=1 Tax=Caballeronia sordidicola TaxID=196367 RepID=A0A242M414_CABSO|nr:hypothetical protein PAMC26510_37500 [Caballeronia sordidicola]